MSLAKKTTEPLPKHPKYARLLVDVSTLGGTFKAGTVMCIRSVYLVPEYGASRGCCGIGVDGFEIVDSPSAALPLASSAVPGATVNQSAESESVSGEQLANPLDGFDIDL